MIAWLEGTLREKNTTRCVVVCGGVGYGVRVPASTYARLPEVGGKAAFFIHTHVREDALELFGFGTRAEQEAFELLLSISGIGPRVALNILSGISPGDLFGAILSGNPDRLRVVPGVGRKTAEKIVFELKDKLPAGAVEGAPAAGPAGTAADLASALVNLGYKRPLAERVVQKILREQGEEAAFDELLRSALQELN
ncbi:MAG: Holliday junction branch migration protein RuvA [Bdellovibrionota bacterium]